MRLDLAHSGRSTADTTGTTTAHVNAAAHAHGGERQGSNVAGEQEPEEGVAGLRLTADLHLVVGGVVDDAGRVGVVVVRAAVSAELGGKDNSGDEDEQNVECVENGRDHGMTLDTLVEGRRNEVEEREHRECGSEHNVVRGRGGVGVARCDGVTDQCHDQEGEEELEPSEGEVDDLRHGEVGLGELGGGLEVCW